MVMVAAGALTVMVQTSVFEPSSDVTVICATPGAIATTLPPSTVAISVLSLDQLTFLLVAFSGVKVRASSTVSPISSSADLGFTETDSTRYTPSFTFTEQVAFFPPSFVVTVTRAFPTPTAVTFPSMTVTTEPLSTDQLTLVLVAFSGRTLAVRVSSSPTVISTLVLSRDTDSTATSFCS